MIARRSEPEQEYTPHPQKQYTSSIQITPPQNFEITAVEKEDAPKPEPPSVAPKPFKDVGIFQNVDSHAVEVCHLYFSFFVKVTLINISDVFFLSVFIHQFLSTNVCTISTIVAYYSTVYYYSFIVTFSH